MFYTAQHINGQELDRHSFKIEHVYEMGKMLAQIHNLGVTHNDFSKRNLIFSGNKITGILDFEYAKFSNKKEEFINDLAHSMVLLLISYSVSYIPFYKRLKEFLSAYCINVSNLFERTNIIIFLKFHAQNEKEKYQKLNPKGDAKLLKRNFKISVLGIKDLVPAST